MVLCIYMYRHRRASVRIANADSTYVCVCVSVCACIAHVTTLSNLNANSLLLAYKYLSFTSTHTPIQIQIGLIDEWKWMQSSEIVFFYLEIHCLCCSLVSQIPTIYKLNFTFHWWVERSFFFSISHPSMDQHVFFVAVFFSCKLM